MAGDTPPLTHPDPPGEDRGAPPEAAVDDGRHGPGRWPRPSGDGRSAVTVLADAPARALVTALGEAARPLSVMAMQDRAVIDVAPRLVRDRIRDLQRYGVVGPAAATGPDGRRWVLTDAGRDLFRLLALMGRIAGRASGVDDSVRGWMGDTHVGATLESLADPVVQQIMRGLTDGPVDPDELERRCAPTSRRTVYRRLDTLVRNGAVRRTATRTVPRRTRYDLEERWRPVTAILALAAWWEWRHQAPSISAATFDLEGMLAGIAPRAKVPAAVGEGVVRCVVTASGGPEVEVLVRAAAGRLEIARPGDQDADATAIGSPAAWTGALVTDQHEALATDGARALAEGCVASLRAALLAYLR